MTRIALLGKCPSWSSLLRKCVVHLYLKIGTHGVQELFFLCDLKPLQVAILGGLLNSYDKGNSFTYTGPGFHSMSL